MRHVLAAVVLVALTACSTTRSDQALWREKKDGRRVRTPIAVKDLDTHEAPLADLRAAAVLSAAVYHREETLPEVTGWEKKPRPDREPIKGRLETPGLTYELYVNESRTPKAAMLVFRGSAIPLDWYSNFRWITALVPYVEDHYEQVLKLTPTLVKHIHDTYGDDTEIITAGHSLGGGLAHAAAYVACGGIKTVFAFDTSPVTKRSEAKKCASDARPQHVYRVYEQSEILSWPRYLIRTVGGLDERNPKMVEIKVHLFDGIAIRAHSMTRLALRLDQELR